MSSLSDEKTNLFRLFSDREYRRAYVESFLNTSIAAQIKVNREKRNLSQLDLANLSGMKQPRISALENVNYESWSIRTLKRIAEAFDLALVVRFESFSQAIAEIEGISRESLERPSYSEEEARGLGFSRDLEHFAPRFLSMAGSNSSSVTDFIEYGEKYSRALVTITQAGTVHNAKYVEL